MGWKECFQYNTSLEKKCFLLVAVLSGVVLVLFICLLSSAHETGTCDRPECIRAATFILDTVDLKVDPCDDFYNFACGTFLRNAFSLGQSRTMSYLVDLMRNNLKEIVMETNNEGNVSRMLKMQREFYRACTNEKAIEQDDNQTFLKLLDEIVGGWPVIKTYKWPEREFEWEKTMMKARTLGFFYEFYFKVDVYHSYTPHTYNLWIKPPSRENISSFQWKDQNVNIIAEIASALGAQSVDVSTSLRRTIFFVEQLEQIIEKYNNATAQRISEFKKTKIKNLDHKYIKINWYNLLKNITGLPLKEDDLVIFDVDDYFRDLYYLLMKTPKRIQANYMAWAVISTNIDYMTENVREKYKKIKKSEEYAKADTLSRSDKCYKVSIGLFQYVAESEYIRRYTPPEKRKYILEIITNVKQELETALRNNAWMDQDMKDITIRRLRSIKSAVGWTDTVHHSGKFEELFGYHKVKIISEKLVDMARTLALHGVNRYYSRLMYTPTEIVEEYFKAPHLQVNAYYTKYLRTTIILTPIVQGIIFDEHRPHYMNYGFLGSIIGHELTHGIIEDATDLSLENNTKWTNKSRESFMNVSQCLVDDYDVYLSEKEHLAGFSKNGSTALEENLADFTGVNLAYTAYQEWVRAYKIEESLPGIKFTPNQIFWITASNFQCYNPRVPMKDGAKKMGRHPAPNFRVLGRIRNSPYFAKDFGCPEGSRMNPKKKCRIFT